MVYLIPHSPAAGLQRSGQPRLAFAIACALVLRVLSAGAPTALEAPVQQGINDRQISGAVLLVADREKVLFESALGVADLTSKRPMREDAFFWIASMTKPITCTALMMLVDEGKVDVDAPVSKYLSEFGDQMVVVESDAEHVLLKRPSRPLRVRDLLTHTSGITRRSLPGTMDTISLAMQSAAYAAQPLQSDPGSKFAYSNPGINVVGRIIEVVAHMPYADFLRTRLFEPLGMHETTFWPKPEQLARLAKCYGPTADKADLQEAKLDGFRSPLSDPSRQAFPGGGLFSTSRDVAKFCRMILNRGMVDGHRYLSDESFNLMTSRQTPSPITESYGFGWWTTNGLIVHAGGWQTNMTIDPQHGLITILMVQCAGWRSEEGKKIESNFRKAALAEFGKDSEKNVTPK